MENLACREVFIEEGMRKRLVGKNMVLLLLGRLVSLIGSSVYSFAIGLYILKVTGSGLNFALTIFLATLPRVILGPVAGVMADGVDRKKMAVILDILSGVLVLSLFGLSVFDEMRLVYIYGTTLLLNVCNVFFDTAISASIPNMVDDESLTRINSLSSVITSVASIIGPALGGLIFALINIKIFLLINGISFVLSGISEMFIDFKAKEKIYGVQEKKQEKKSSFWMDLVEGFRYIQNTKWVMILGISAALLNMMVIMGFNVAFPVIVKNVWLFTDVQFGIIMGAFPAGMIIASLLMAVVPQSEKNYKKFIAGFCVFALSMIALGILASGLFANLNNILRMIIVGCIFLIVSFASAFINIPFMVTMQKEVPGEKLGRVFGVFGTLSGAAAPLGAILGGAIINYVSPWLVPLSCGIVVLFIAFITARNEELKKI